jgi:hypothetical protein
MRSWSGEVLPPAFATIPATDRLIENGTHVLGTGRNVALAVCKPVLGPAVGVGHGFTVHG